MLTVIKSGALLGIEGIEVGVEVDSSRGLPAFNIIGLGDTAVKEAAERVRSAILNSGFNYPRGRVTVNLSPAWVHKKGSHFDLPMALGLLGTEGELEEEHFKNRAFIGELTLTGKIISVRGILPMVKALINSIKEIYLPRENYTEGFLLTKGLGVKIIPVSSLGEMVEILKGKQEPLDFAPPQQNDANEIETLDFSDVKGHWAAKEAIIVAVAGGHGILLIGPPGTGKTMLAKRIPSILPPMTTLEQLETCMVYSLIGAMPRDVACSKNRPFRQLNRRATAANILGGGYEPLPGEVSLANNGILFMDEFLEFSAGQIELLRKPLEEGSVTIVRRGQPFCFPAKFTLVGATNPCKCGYLGDSTRACSCSSGEIDSYRNKISGPMADRIDICVEISRINYKALVGGHSPSSEEMRKKVENARRIQQNRFKNLSITLNGQMNQQMLKQFCGLGKKEEEFMKKAYEKFSLSPRKFHKILRISRTIADIAGSENVQISNLAAALNYTRFFWNSEE